MENDEKVGEYIIVSLCNCLRVYYESIPGPEESFWTNSKIARLFFENNLDYFLDLFSLGPVSFSSVTFLAGIRTKAAQNLPEILLGEIFLHQ